MQKLTPGSESQLHVLCFTCNFCCVRGILVEDVLQPDQAELYCCMPAGAST